MNFNEIMTPVRTEAGTVIVDDRNGEPLVQPLVFYNKSDVSKMFKDVEEKRKQDNQAIRNHFSSRLADRRERLAHARGGEKREGEGGEEPKVKKRATFRRSGGSSSRRSR